jgi:hypothetical protein
LYTPDTLAAEGVKIMKASHQEAMFFNIDGCAHRSWDPRKDKYGFEKALNLFCRSGADTLFLLDPRVTAAKIKHIEAKVQEAVPGANVIFHPTTATPGESEDNSMQCMGGMIIIISPKWAELKYRSRVEQSGLGLVARLKNPAPAKTRTSVLANTRSGSLEHICFRAPVRQGREHWRLSRAHTSAALAGKAVLTSTSNMWQANGSPQALT